MVNFKTYSLSAYSILIYSLLSSEISCNEDILGNDKFWGELNNCGIRPSNIGFVSNVTDENNFDSCFYTDYVKETVDKGLSIYKKINQTKHIEKKCYAEFISTIRDLISLQNNAKLIFKSDSVRLKLVYKNCNFTIDYDYGVNDSVFIMKDEDGNLNIKECSLDNILSTLESYFERIPERITSAA